MKQLIEKAEALEARANEAFKNLPVAARIVYPRQYQEAEKFASDLSELVRDLKALIN